MTDTSSIQSSFWSHSVSESDNDQMNSTANLRINLSFFIPLDGTESNPNVSVSGFIDEFPFTGPGTQL